MTQPTKQLTKQPAKHYIKIPNHIIHDSFTINNYILPVYLYSYTHRDINRNCLVDTSIENIMNYFRLTETTVRHIEGDILRALNYLEIFAVKKTDEEMNKLIGELSPKQIKEMYLEYRFDEEKFIKKVENKYTMICIEDYYKIFNATGAGDTNSIRQYVYLINYLCFIKMKVGLEYSERCKKRYIEIQKGQVNKEDLKYTRQSALGIAKYINKSTRTVSQNIETLIKLGIVSIESSGNTSKFW